MEKAITAPPVQERRLWYLDFLRILATFAVIMLHVSPLGYLEVDVASGQWKAMNLISSLGIWAVPVFYMISGALFLSEKKAFNTKRLYQKTIARMLTSYLAWSAMYALVHCMLFDKGKWTFLNQLLRGHYHMWYILSIVSLYWITPLLRKITESKKMTEYLLFCGFLLSFLFPRVLGFLTLFDLPHADVLQSLQSLLGQLNPYSALSGVYYFVLGHYLHDYPPSKSMRRAIYILGVAGFAATALLTDWHSNLTGARSTYFHAYTSLNILAMAAAIFVFFQSYFSGFHAEGRLQKAIVHTSKCSFGVYLAHAFVIERLQINYLVSPVHLFVRIVLVSLMVYLISHIVSSILNRIPIVNRYIV